LCDAIDFKFDVVNFFVQGDLTNIELWREKMQHFVDHPPFWL
jgi:hypothetical protein